MSQPIVVQLFPYSYSQAFVCVFIVVSYMAILPIVYRLLRQARDAIAKVHLVALQVANFSEFLYRVNLVTHHEP